MNVTFTLDSESTKRLQAILKEYESFAGHTPSYQEKKKLAKMLMKLCEEKLKPK